MNNRRRVEEFTAGLNRCPTRKERRRSWISPLLKSSPNTNPLPRLLTMSFSLIFVFFGISQLLEEALQLVLSECKQKVKIVDLCEKGDAFIREQTGNKYKNVKKKIERGVAFPTCLSTRRDGSKMTLSHSKKLSQLTADNAQWEDRQLMRSGAVRGTEVQTTFDDEDERKIILLVHDSF